MLGEKLACATVSSHLYIRSYTSAVLPTNAAAAWDFGGFHSWSLSCREDNYSLK